AAGDRAVLAIGPHGFTVARLPPPVKSRFFTSKSRFLTSRGVSADVAMGPSGRGGTMPAPTRERIGQPRDTVSGMEIPGFRGEGVAAGHADYDDARAVWNGTVDRRPRLIA